jgi:Tol biopolymer transport system component
VAAPFFAPDGRSIAYFTSSQLKRIGLTGGEPEVLASNLDVPRGGSWAPNGVILFADRGGISRVSADGAGRELLIAVDNELFSAPRLLPDGDTLVFSSAPLPLGGEPTRVVAQSISTGKRTVLVNGGSAPRYLSTGHLLYVVGSRLFGIAFDASELAVSGTPLPLLENVLAGVFGSPAANYDVAEDGTLIYVDQGSPIAGALPVWVDREGREEPVGVEACVCQEMALSPDGSRIALQDIKPDVSETGIAVWTAEQGTLVRLTDVGGLQEGPLWTPDSARIVYSIPTDGLFIRRADGTGTSELLVSGAGLVPWGWTAGGELVFGARAGATRNISVLEATGAGQARTLHSTRANLLSGALSPNGRWLAYESDETGQQEVHVRPFPNLDASRIQVSSGGGEEPRWARDGRTLFFRSPTHLMAAAAEGGSDIVRSVCSTSPRTGRSGAPREPTTSPRTGAGFCS